MQASAMHPKLRTSDSSEPGITRVRHGRGFAYRSADGTRVSDARTLERIQWLTIPLAWLDVWICSNPRGHLQATGTDAAARTQYLYHPAWRALRDQQKFRDMEEFGRRLPRLRSRVRAALAQGGDLDRERVAAGAVRLLDVGLFRIGGERYAEDSGHLGIATLTREHVTLAHGEVIFDYPAKSGGAACAPDQRPRERRAGRPPAAPAQRTG